MLTIAKLFGKSPFKPLQNHMEKVSLCINELPALFKAIFEKNMPEIEKIAKKISKLEHEADLTKNDIRNHLPKSLFLPINREDLLIILSLQDSFADKAEDVAVLSTFRTLEGMEDIKEDFETFYKKNIESFDLAKKVIEEFDSLLEASFGGIEAEKVKNMTEELAFKEHEIDKLQYLLLKQLYKKGENLSLPLFTLWQTFIREVGDISNIAENLGNRIRMILELK
jgi:predicted phosphate transport protein (TIGR00153 family)